MEETGCGTGAVAPAARNSRKLLRFLRGAAAEKLDALNKNLFFQGGELLANGWAGWLAGLAGTVGGNIILSLRTSGMTLALATARASLKIRVQFREMSIKYAGAP